MHSPSEMSALEARVRALVDDRLMKAFWNAAGHFKTRDLVLIFDESQDIDPVTAYLREKLATAEDLPETMRKKLIKPAKDVNFHMTTSETVFWLVVMFADGEMVALAVNAKQIAPGGTA